MSPQVFELGIQLNWRISVARCVFSRDHGPLLSLLVHEVTKISVFHGLGFQYSVSLDEGEVEDEMSTGSISGPDDKPGPVFGSGGGDGEGSGGGNGGGFRVFCILNIAGFGGVGGRFLVMR